MYVWLEVLVDDIALVNFKHYAVDLDEMTRSIHSDGELYILTCGCGVPGCAGIVKGVKVTQGRDAIHWKVTGPKHFNFTFEQKQYIAEIGKVIKQGKQLLAAKKLANTLIPEIVPMQNEKYF